MTLTTDGRAARRKELALFIVAGGSAAVVNIGSRILLSHVVSFELAVTLAYCLGIITAFLLNRLLVFRDAGKAIHHQIFWFIAINLLGLLQTVVVSVILERWAFPAIGLTWNAELIAHTIGVVVPIASSYVGHKYVTFAAR